MEGESLFQTLNELMAPKKLLQEKEQPIERAF